MRQGRAGTWLSMATYSDRCLIARFILLIPWWDGLRADPEEKHGLANASLKPTEPIETKSYDVISYNTNGRLVAKARTLA
jgi:hypothetical protein